MTRSGRAFALPTPERRTAATASSSSPPGPGPRPGSRLLPTPVAGNFNDGAEIEGWKARHDRQKKLRNGNGIGTPLPVAIALLPTSMASDFGADKAFSPVRPSGVKRQTGLPDVIIHRIIGEHRHGEAGSGPGRLLPTPDTGCSPNGHGRRGGRPGNGHQSGKGLDPTAAALAPAQAAQGPGAWGDYEQAIRRWGASPQVPRAAARRARTDRAAEAGSRVRRVDDGHPGIPRTRQLRLIGNGVVPQQAAAVLRLLITVAAAPPLPGADPGTRAAA